MEVEYRYGNLLETDAKYICHCVNARGKMNSGVAKQIRQQFPRAYDVYMDKYQQGKLALGSVISVSCNNKTILNLVGQDRYGYDGAQYIDYRALRRGISLINKNVFEPVAFPLIGCGLAGGDWKLVSEIIEEESTNFQPIVYQLNDEVPYEI